MPLPASLSPAPFELRSTAWLLTALRLHTAHVPTITAALDARFADSPGLFDNDELVLDLSALRAGDAPLDYPTLIAHLRRHRLLPVAAQGGSVNQMQAARAAGLSLATEPEAAARPVAPPPEPAAPPAWDDTVPVVDEPAVGESTAVPTMVIDRPLRSGQRVYARGGDLIVLQAVSVGAEVIADGHIHVYAPLRGRAMAGARGDTAARIFSTCMEAQLVSIAGIYRTTETPLPPAVQGQPAHVRLAGTRLLVEPLRP